MGPLSPLGGPQSFAGPQVGGTLWCLLGSLPLWGFLPPSLRGASWAAAGLWGGQAGASDAMFFGSPGGLVEEPAGMTSSAVHMTCDTVSERLRRWTRNPLGSARRGSNPLGVALARRCGGGHASTKHTGNNIANAGLRKSSARRNCCLSSTSCNAPGAPAQQLPGC